MFRPSTRCATCWRAGQRAGVFRKDVDPVDLHMTISALSFFNVANRPTFSTIFKRDMTSAKSLVGSPRPSGRYRPALRQGLKKPPRPRAPLSTSLTIWTSSYNFQSSARITARSEALRIHDCAPCQSSGGTPHGSHQSSSIRRRLGISPRARCTPACPRTGQAETALLGRISRNRSARRGLQGLRRGHEGRLRFRALLGQHAVQAGHRARRAAARQPRSSAIWRPPISPSRFRPGRC